MRTLVYKQTHQGDPDAQGRFGAGDCMGNARSWEFDAVIGIGGRGEEAKRNGIAGKLNWIGVGARRHTKVGMKHPVVTFDHFVNFGDQGPELRTVAPELAKRMKKARQAINFDDYRVIVEIESLLATAMAAPPSPAHTPQPKAAKTRQGLNGRSLSYEELHTLAKRFPPAAAWFHEKEDVL